MSQTANRRVECPFCDGLGRQFLGLVDLCMEDCDCVFGNGLVSDVYQSAAEGTLFSLSHELEQPDLVNFEDLFLAFFVEIPFNFAFDRPGQVEESLRSFKRQSKHLFDLELLFRQICQKCRASHTDDMGSLTNFHNFLDSGKLVNLLGGVLA